MGKFWHDITRDKGSSKTSITKVIGLVGSATVYILFGLSMFIMWQKQEIDHILVGEMMGFVLTLLGFKNNFGINRKEKKTPAIMEKKMGVDKNFEKKLDDEADF